jgi:acetyltransferase-like isoleucine patch superfamily enzyme
MTDTELSQKMVRISDDVKLGKNVSFFGWANLYGCELGNDVTVGPFVEIQSGVIIGNNVKIQSHTFICSGVTIEDEVFIGHGVMFTNDRFPRSTNTDGSPKGGGDWTLVRTEIKRRASIGSNVTILCGITIGEDAIIGAGSVVTKNVPPKTVVAGNPAKFIRSLQEGEN